MMMMQLTESTHQALVNGQRERYVTVCSANAESEWLADSSGSGCHCTVL